MQCEIIPAVMPVDRGALATLADVVRPFAQTVQLDIMDGVFVQGTSWPLAKGDFEGLRLPYAEEIFWEVHLMVKDPSALGGMFIQAGARRVIAHIEAFTDIDAAREAFGSWQKGGVQAGVSLLLDTPISALEELIHDVEVVQVMGIQEIGAQGRPFDLRAMVRVRELRNRFPQAIISVDGGVNVQNASQLAMSGANRLCVGSAILKANDPRAAYEGIVRAVANVP